jgi:putative endonuclease
MSYFVYILQSQKDFTYYIGYSKDPAIRIIKHNNSKIGYTATKKPWVLVYTEEYNTKSDAIKREKFLKQQKNTTFYKQLISC